MTVTFDLSLLVSSNVPQPLVLVLSNPLLLLLPLLLKLILKWIYIGKKLIGVSSAMFYQANYIKNTRNGIRHSFNFTFISVE